MSQSPNLRDQVDRDLLEFSQILGLDHNISIIKGSFGNFTWIVHRIHIQLKYQDPIGLEFRFEFGSNLNK